MSERYGIDVDLTSGVLQSRSARWLRVRILGLLSTPFDYQVTAAGLLRLPTTRLQSALFPMTIEKG
jgi:hypothetical protein